MVTTPRDIAVYYGSSNFKVHYSAVIYVEL